MDQRFRRRDAGSTVPLQYGSEGLTQRIVPGHPENSAMNPFPPTPISECLGVGGAPPRLPRSKRNASRLHHDRPWTLVGSPGAPLGAPVPACERAGHTETVVVVPFAGGVPVAVGGAEVFGLVVPGTAAQHALAGRSGSRAEPNRTARKIAWRKRHVSACSAWAIQARTR